MKPPSEAALRAAKKLFPKTAANLEDVETLEKMGGTCFHSNSREAIEKAARIIDQQTSLPELIASLRETNKELHELVKDEADDPEVGIVGWDGLNQLCAENKALLTRVIRELETS